MVHLRVMDWTMEQIAGEFGRDAPMMGGLDRLPVVDETGLSGRFDINLEFLRPPRNSPSVAATDETEAPGTSFVDALKSQAGLRLVKQVGAVTVIVVDHVERPTEN